MIAYINLNVYQICHFGGHSVYQSITWRENRPVVVDIFMLCKLSMFDI